MTTLAYIASAAGLACVMLLIQRSVWNHPCAILSASLFAVGSSNAKQYPDASLPLIFIVINLYGWWSWRQAQASAGDILVERLTTTEQVAALSGMIGLTLFWGAVMASQTDASFPYIEGAVAMLGVGAQILQALRKLETWFVWIAVALIAIPLFTAKGLYPAAGFCVVLLGLAIWGLRDWLVVTVSQSGAAPGTAP